MKYIKIAVISSIIGLLAGEVFIWVVGFLLLYFSGYIAGISGDGIMVVPFCLLLRVRPIATSIVAFSVGFSKLKNNITLQKLTTAKYMFFVVVIITIVIIWSIFLSTIQLQWSFSELVELYFKPWCSFE